MLSPNGKSYILEKYNQIANPDLTGVGEHTYYLSEPGTSFARYIKYIVIDLYSFEIAIYEAKYNDWWSDETSQDSYLKEVYYLYDDQPIQLSF